MSEQVFPSMASILKDGETAHFKLEYFEVTEHDVKFVQLRDILHGRSEYDGFKTGLYIRLCKKDGEQWNKGVIMSDTWMEKQTNVTAYKKARGDVLIAGLGLGMVLLAIQKKPEVSSVTVVELEQEIIDLVKHQLPLNSKVTIIQGDIFQFKTDQKFDTIYFDIWDTLCADNWEEMKKLHRKFRSRLKANGWMSSWRKDYHQDLARRDKMWS